MTWFNAAEPNLSELLRLNARFRAQKAAIVAGDEQWNWQQCECHVARMASVFDTLGLNAGDRVVVLMNNSLSMLQAMLGAIWGGYVAVPLNTSVSDDGIAKMIDDCNAAALIASDEHIERIDNIRSQLQVDLSGRLLAVGSANEDWQQLAELLDNADANRNATTVDPSAACNVIYSSGTTGLPKGIVHSHACRMAWAYDMSIALRYDSDARTLISLGLYSNITWVTLLATILCGGTLYLMRAFDVQSCLKMFSDHRLTHAGMVPIQFQRMLAAPDFDRYDLSSIRALMCCGSPLHQDLKVDIVKRIPGQFIELYGLTEGIVTIQDPDEALDNPASVGRPCPGQDICIVDNNDREVATGESGEILGYGRLLMSGYLNRDDANAEATRTDDQGRRWIRTGDIGRIDEQGNLYIVDRKKDMIISGGQNIYPADIESVVKDHEFVDDVAVIGVNSARWGETPLAVIVSSNADLTDEVLLEWVNARLGKQQRISGIQFIDELPRNPNGKVLKRELRDSFADLQL